MLRTGVGNGLRCGCPYLALVTYLPFGPQTQRRHGDGRVTTLAYDLNYRTTAIQSPGFALELLYDHVGNITALSSSLTGDGERYRYDGLDRLRSVDNDGGVAKETFTYDATGNRTSRRVSGQAVEPYSYPTDSHRLTDVAGRARSYDARGNTLLGVPSDGSLQYADDNRLVAWQAASATTGYLHNARGERVRKHSGLSCAASACVQAHFVYDESGQLIGEYDQDGLPRQEHVWFDGAPVGLLEGSELMYVHTDHLGTPRRITDGSQALRWDWSWLENAFGQKAPATIADGVGYGLRYPGQYFDAESGLHYNYFRDYEPGTGRYIESDPIGLAAGPSTFGYVASNPFVWTDRLGLSAEMCTRPLLIAPMAPGIRHCFLRFNGSNSDTLSFDPNGTHPDPKPEWGVCVDVIRDEDDDCLRREMLKCRGPDYDFLGNNCCHCVENALKACDQGVPRDAWPNWPINPGPQPGEPGYRP